MDSNTFDRLAKSLRARPSRRATLRFLSGLGLVGSAVIPRSASAKQCKGNEQKCGSKCIPKKDCCQDKECGNKVAGQVCKNGTCKCPGGKKKCGKQCIAKNVCCTQGKKGCPYSEVCAAGACVTCIAQPCFQNEDCCTDLCENFITFECVCVPSGSSCTSNRQCCNGNCDAGECGCDPNGAGCDLGTECCSGNCVNNECVA